ncbi:unnamed protein product [Mycena citricolor]|uniref:Uncharacterized protein n=1 Tax=Mycena citricolor TaxID=2018698 RepID=A0AAD2K8K1_9AGAR|nr:unnamed protein product [Mycena citricolor]
MHDVSAGTPKPQVWSPHAARKPPSRRSKTLSRGPQIISLGHRPPGHPFSNQQRPATARTSIPMWSPTRWTARQCRSSPVWSKWKRYQHRARRDLLSRLR